MEYLTQLKQHLCPGTAYRRAELAQWSKHVDQHIKMLIEEGVLTQLESGLYYCPKESLFGMVPIRNTLVNCFRMPPEGLTENTNRL